MPTCDSEVLDSWVQLSAVPISGTDLGKVAYTHMRRCHQAILVPVKKAVMPSAWEGNRRSGVAWRCDSGLVRETSTLPTLRKRLGRLYLYTVGTLRGIIIAIIIIISIVNKHL